jgi:ribosomal-protein-alanine N-acetyltransferase
MDQKRILRNYTDRRGISMVDNYIDILNKNFSIPTDRLLLRKFTEADAQDILEYASDEQTVRYLTWEGMKTLEQAMNIIHSFYSKDGVYAIELKETGQCIGAINLSVIQEHEKAGFG